MNSHQMKATASKYRAPCDYKRDAPSLRRLISTYPTNCSPINNKHNKLVSDVLLESDVLSKKIELTGRNQKYWLRIRERYQVQY